MELQHHGVKGMKWGVRRYRNPDDVYYTSRGWTPRSDGTYERHVKE